MRMIRNVALVAVVVSGLLIGCGDDDHGHDDNGATGEGDFSLAGEWTGEFGDETIGGEVGEAWGGTTIIEFDNEARYVVRQNSADSEWDPDKFTLVVWTEFDDEGGFYYCTVDFGLDSAEEARESEATADDSDPANDGCGGFEWTYLQPASAGA